MSRATTVMERDVTMAWTIELDRLELDVIRAEHALPRGEPVRTDLWRRPDLTGPPPAELFERAYHLLERQQACLERMTDDLVGAARQRAVAEAIRRATVADESYPVYVDEAV